MNGGKMRAAVYYGIEDLRVEKTDVPAIGDEDVDL